MGRTRTELCTEIASIIGLGNDDLAAEDLAKIDKVINGVVQSLAARDVYGVSNYGSLGPSGGDIEDVIFEDLAICCAPAAARRFDDRDPSYAGAAVSAEDRMKLVAAPPRIRRELRIDPALLPSRRGYYSGR